jgi:hypothetical protein
VLAGPDDPNELARFTDGSMAGHMRELHVPGAAVEVVSAGRVLLEKGYGVADDARDPPAKRARIDFGESLRFTVVFAIPFVTAALAVPLAVVAVRSWPARRWRPAARIQVSATALAGVLFPFFLANWRLFGVGG